MSGVDKLSDLAVYQEDAAVHILFPVLGVLQRDNGFDGQELIALQARVKPVKREVLTTRPPRFGQAMIGEDGRRFCIDCEKWYDFDQMDRPSQCRSCHLGGS